MHYQANNRCQGRQDKGFHFIVGTVVFILMSMSASLYSQPPPLWLNKSLTRGKVWLTVSNSLAIGPIDHPTRWYTLDYPGYTVGADLSDHLTYLETGGYLIYGERDGNAAAYTINGRFAPSSKYVNPTVTSELITNYNMAEDPTLLAEEIVTGAHHVKDLDVDISHRSMVWSYPKYDDFVVQEYTITNTGSTTLDNLHFGERNATWITERGDWLGPGSDYDDLYGWDEANDCFYFYDGWSFRWEDETLVSFNYGPGPQTGDIGDPADIWEPNAQYHELYAPGYLAFLCLDPAGGTVYQNILEYIGQGTSTDAPLEDVIVRQGTDTPARFLEVMTHQQPRMSWEEARDAGGEGGNKFERAPEMILACGPYTLAAGESITLVFAKVLGEMDRAKIVEGGVENVLLLATASKDSLRANIEACRELYTNGYQIAHHPPMTPTNGPNTLALKPIGGGVEIMWPAIPEIYADPVTGENDLAGYKVYRSSYFTIGPWTLVSNIPKTEAVVVNDSILFQDAGLPMGVGVYYAVTSYDTDGNESGKVNANRYPVYPLRAPNPDITKADSAHKVYVVPNPFRQHSGLLGTGEELRMEFINIPALCTIRIYTLTGELVRTIEHDDGSGSKAWGSIERLDYQVNEWMMYVTPGVYIYHVESHVTGQEGKSYIGKFAIIK